MSDLKDMTDPAEKAPMAAACLDAIVATLTEIDDPGLMRFATDIRATPRKDPRAGPAPLGPHPGLTHLETATASAAELGGFHDCCAEAARSLNWVHVYEDAQFGTGVGEGMLATQLVGTYGIFPSTSLAVGFFLIAPGVVYPEHTHAAEEIYFCLSGALTLKHGLGSGPFRIDPGGYSITPPHRLHSLMTGPEPALILYVWRGDLCAPLWVWEEDATGFERVQWRRKPGQSWRRDSRERVSTAILRQATE